MDAEYVKKARLGAHLVEALACKIAIAKYTHVFSRLVLQGNPDRKSHKEMVGVADAAEQVFLQHAAVNGNVGMLEQLHGAFVTCLRLAELGIHATRIVCNGNAATVYVSAAIGPTIENGSVRIEQEQEMGHGQA